MIYYVITAILFAILVLLYVLSRRERVVQVFQAQLNPDDRLRAAAQLAQSMRATGAVGNVPRVRAPLHRIKVGYRAVCAKVRDGVSLYEYEKWLYENYYSLVLAIKPSAYRAFGSLPHAQGRTRVLALARLICGSTRCALTRDNIRECVEQFNRFTPLRHSECMALPAALRLALIEQIAQIADMCKLDSAMRRAARADKQPNARYCRYDSYLYYWIHAGKPLDVKFIYRNHDLNPDNLDAAYACSLVDACGWISNAITSASGLDGMFDETYMLSLSPLDVQLRADETYANMDNCSKFVYLETIQSLSRLFHASERAIVDSARVLAEQLHVHFGCVLFDYRYALKAQIHGKSPSIVRKSTRQSDQKLFIGAVVALDVALSVLCVLIARPLWARILCGVCVPIAALLPAQYIVSRLAGMFLPMRATPRMNYTELPDQGATVVAVSHFLHDAEQARRAVRSLIAMQSVNRDPNITFCLLADLPASNTQTAPSDQEIFDALDEFRDAQQITLCVRKRTFDGKRYSAHERKRGAIQCLCGALIGGGWSEFSYVSHPIEHAEFLLMLDDDSRLAVGAVKQAANTLLHPLNAKYDLLTFENQYKLSSVTTRYAWQYLDASGVESYCNYSDFFYRLCGHSIYCGKGICRIDRFYARLSDALPDNRVLSHDILEGAILDTGSLGITTYEDCPTTFVSDTERQNRWTRGDILLAAFARKKYCSQPIYGYVILSNLIATLRPIGACLLWLGLLISGNLPLLFAAAVVSLLIPLLETGFLLLSPDADIRPRYLFAKLAMTLGKTIFQVVMLPFWAVNNTLLWIKTIFKFVFGRDKLLEWKTFYASQRTKGYARHAAMILPSVLAMTAIAGVYYRTLPVVVYAAAFVLASNLCYRFGKEHRAFKKIRPQDRVKLSDLARRTAHYFCEMTSTDALIADNIQIEPKLGRSATTSPTNLGFSMLACVCMCRLGIIDRETAIRRIATQTAQAERLEKWHGHLYNWYDCATMQPVDPLYVSSVDSGNWVACLITVRGFCETCEELELADRIRALTDAVEFEPLYDPLRKQFHIGYDVVRRQAQGHYDLLASEARLLAYLGACRLGDTAAWTGMSRRMLGRKGNLLASWSGTAFEYLMPEIFLPEVRYGLLSTTVRRAVAVMHDKKCNGLWGVSESGYYDFDAQLRYQYQAFGLGELSLRSQPNRCVVAPYASMLALRYAPRRVVSNYDKLVARGALDDMGLCEALDYTQGKQIVRSHMTHHQGMLLAAVTNALTDGCLQSYFTSDPTVRGGRLMLEERMPIGRYASTNPSDFVYLPTKGAEWSAQGDPLSDPCAVNAMVGDRYALVIDDRGCGYATCGSDTIYRYRPDWDADWGAFVYFREGDELFGATYAPIRERAEDYRVVHRTDCSEYVNTRKNCSMQVFTPHMFSGEVRRIRLDNDGDTERVVDIGFYAPVTLCPLADDCAHPAFSDMFVETFIDGPTGSLIARRKSRAQSGDRYCGLAVNGMSLTAHSSVADFIGREGSLRDPRAMRSGASDAPTVGDVLYPCLAGVGQVRIAPHASCTVTFALIYDTELQPLKHKLEQAVSQDFSHYAYQSATLQTLSKARKYLDTPTCAQTAYALAASLVRGARDPEQLRSMFATATARLPLGLDRSRRFLLADHWNGDGELHDLIRATIYCNLCRIDCDLIVLYDEQDIYNASVLREIARICGVADLEKLPFVRIVQRKALSADDYGLLRMYAWRISSERIRIESVARASEDYKWKRLPIADNLLESGCGGLDARGDYWVTSRPPRCYSNIVAGEHGGFVVTENGGGFSFGDNSQSDKWTRWSNQPILDPPCEHVSLLTARGDAIRINRLVPLGHVVHGLGYTSFCGGADAIGWRCTQSVADDGRVKVWRIRLTNGAQTPQRVQIVLQLRPLLGASDLDAELFDQYGEDRVLRICNARNGKSLYLRGLQPARVADNAYCLRGLETQEPTVLRIAHAACSRPAHAIYCDATLDAGGAQTLYFAAGEDRDAVYACDAEHIDRQIDGHVRASAALNPFTLYSKDRYLDALFNHRLAYQVVVSRLRARCGFYQAGGAIGFRDQLQDCLTVLYRDPAAVRKHLLDCAEHQYLEGDVMHWWHKPRFGVRTQISDDRLFLVYLSARYLQATGDESILQERVPYLLSPPLESGQEARLEHGQLTEASETLLQHLRRAIERSMRFGAHGLLLIGSGDWNDALNDIGMRGQGESVWLSMFAVHAIEQISPWLDDRTRAAYGEYVRRLRRALEGCVRDGRYLRAYTDDGVAIGTDEAPACKIDLICQCWAQLAQIGTPQARAAALAAARSLTDERNGIVRLFDPPFDRGFYCGYISGYPQGVRENGGQYTHGAVWYLAACAQAGQRDYADRLLRMLNPLARCADKDAAARYEGEPYVMPADIYTNRDHYGAMGWSWYTGSASWMYDTIVREILGVRIDNNCLVFSRPMLREWEGTRLDYRYRGTVYRITFASGKDDHLRMDGVNYYGGMSIALRPDGGEIELQAVFGGVDNPSDRS